MGFLLPITNFVCKKFRGLIFDPRDPGQPCIHLHPGYGVFVHLTLAFFQARQVMVRQDLQELMQMLPEVGALGSFHLFRVFGGWIDRQHLHG